MKSMTKEENEQNCINCESWEASYYKERNENDLNRHYYDYMDWKWLLSVYTTLLLEMTASKGMQ